MASILELETGSAGTTPPSGFISIYPKTDNKLYLKNDAGVEFQFSTGSALSSTDDLPEGTSNLYFSIERAQDAAGSMMIAGTKITLTYDDALGTVTATINPGTITNTDISGTAAISHTKLNLTNSINNAEINGSANIAHSKMAALTPNKVMTTDGSGKATTSSVGDTQLGFLSSVTSDIQSQIDSKIDDTAGSVDNTNIASGVDAAKIADGSVSNTEFQYLNGATSNIQAQLDAAILDPTTTTGDLIYNNGTSLARLPIGNESDILRVMSGIPSWEEENIFEYFGDGSDGDLNVTGSLTLSQIPYYNTLTIGPGALISTNGFPIYCRTLNLTNAPAGAILRNGNTGQTSSSTNGAAGGGSLAANVLGGSGAGSTGAAGSTNAGLASSAPGTVANSNGGAGGASGASGAGGTGAGVSSQSGAGANGPTHLGRYDQHLLRGAASISGGAGGRGGSSGGGDGTNSSRGAPGGGGGGGVIAIYAAEIITGPSTPAGVITVLGGNAGTCLNQTAGNVGGTGGAGGGGGGYVYIAYAKKTGPTVNSLISANGGNGSTGGNAAGTGVGGNGGNGGQGGRIQLFNVVTNSGLEIIGVAGATGASGSGTTGGAGGNGGSCVANL